jgi:hypothetical protein
MVVETKHLPESLAATGKVALSNETIAKLIGKVRCGSCCPQETPCVALAVAKRVALCVVVALAKCCLRRLVQYQPINFDTASGVAEECDSVCRRSDSFSL